MVFWFKRESYNEANLMAQVRRVSQGLAFAVKALRNPVELARELYPTRGFKRVSGLDSIAFLDNWQVAKSAVGTNTFRETSHSFTLVLQGFLQRHPLQERRRHSGALHHARGLDFVPECEGPGRRDCQGLQVALGPVRAF